MDIDEKKLDTAIIYIQRIANGKNPVNNMPAEEDSVLNNPNVIRCMYFVKEVLEEVKRHDGIIGGKREETEKEEFPFEILDSYAYIEDKPITRFVEQINGFVDVKRYRKISYRAIQRWLLINEYLEEKTFENLGKTFKVPTKEGEQLGIRCEVRRSVRGNEYVVTLYGKKAQEYIVNNLEKIITENISKRI